MTSVTYVEFNGTAHTVDVPEGTSVMQGAIDNNIEGIVAECGGGMACATCHCYVDDAWMDKVGPATEPEHDMLEFSASETRSTSRLSCQIIVSDKLEGLVVHLPEAQF
jgi:2Fe-2S ferredoxin